MTRPALLLAWLLVAALQTVSESAEPVPARPNIVLILADDLGFSDLGCYGSEIATPHLDGLASGGMRFTQFYNGARCCPTRASLLTGLYPHQAGVGHMLGNIHPPGYTDGLNNRCATIAEVLHAGGYRNYHVGKWHVGGLGNGPKADKRNHPLNRGFDHAYGNGGGGGFFVPQGMYRDFTPFKPGADYYVTDAFSDEAAAFVTSHAKQHAGTPFFLHLCYTAPHFPLQAKPADIAKYRGKYTGGWDKLREQRLARQKQLGILDASCALSPRDPVARPWANLTPEERDEWDLRMAVYAGMIDCMDQGVGRVLASLRAAGVEKNTLVMFLSDNGSSAEYLDTWPNPARGHKPGSITGTAESHRCLEVGWANAANTPFREHKMWAHEGGISTPCIVSWPEKLKSGEKLTQTPSHIIDVLPTFLELAGVKYPQTLSERSLTPLEGRSLLPDITGPSKTAEPRTLAWEHEGNRAIRVGDWKLVAAYNKPWELYNLKTDRSETHNLAADQPADVEKLAAQWQAWADRVGVVPWKDLPGSNYKPTAGYRKKSEPVAPK